jgi:hypothetical protein
MRLAIRLDEDNVSDKFVGARVESQARPIHTAARPSGIISLVMA